MSSYRKRDDLESGWLYRVVARRAGSDDEWEHTSYGHYGKPRTYMTLSAARSQCTGMRRDNARYSDRDPREFAVQGSPVTEWQMIPDKD